MASILPDQQNFVDLRNGTTVGIHVVTPVSTSDTITVPTLANSTSNSSTATLRRADGNTATITDDGANTITIAGTAGSQVLVVSVHPASQLNYGAEA